MSYLPSSENRAAGLDPGRGCWTDPRATEQAIRAAQARHESNRRRFVDPATCERDYSTAEIEFMKAMQEYKMRSGRMFPTWSEVLEVLVSLGYRKCEARPPLPGAECDPLAWTPASHGV